jgi:hypothetical protein
MPPPPPTLPPLLPPLFAGAEEGPARPAAAGPEEPRAAPAAAAGGMGTRTVMAVTLLPARCSSAATSSDSKTPSDSRSGIAKEVGSSGAIEAAVHPWRRAGSTSMPRPESQRSRCRCLSGRPSTGMPESSALCSAAAAPPPTTGGASRIGPALWLRLVPAPTPAAAAAALPAWPRPAMCGLLPPWAPARPESTAPAPPRPPGRAGLLNARCDGWPCPQLAPEPAPRCWAAGPPATEEPRDTGRAGERTGDERGETGRLLSCHCDGRWCWRCWEWYWWGCK